jgi:hypothetical protein
VTEEEFRDSIVGKTFARFLKYMFTLLALMNQIDVGRAIALGGTNFFASLVNRDAIDRKPYDAFLHALYIIGAWSSFEAFFDDYCVAVIQSDPKALVTERIAKIKVPITDLLADEVSKSERVYAALKDNSDRGPGVTKFEDILKCIGLDDEVPRDISTHVFDSQQIRHVWAHKAGVADTKYVTAAPRLGFQTGDQVVVSNEKARIYVNAVFTYGSIIINRYRLRFDLPPVKVGDGSPQGSPFKESYDSLYSTDERVDLDITGSAVGNSS